MAEWKYQLVLQFEASELADYDDLVSLEARLEKGLRKQAHVDGHDFGRGECNIFVLTDSPVETAEIVERLLKASSDSSFPRAIAYRELLGENFTVIYPCGETAFDIT